MAAHPAGNPERAFDALVELSRIATEPVRSVSPQVLTTMSKEKSDSSRSAAAALGSTETGRPVANVSIKRSNLESSQASMTSEYRIQEEDKIIFPALHDQLSTALRLAETRLFILFDEWSSLPAEVQPFLAEFLKRGILPIREAVLKIASLEYRSHFSLPERRGVGFELGADISVTHDLDDYYVFDRNPELITDTYATMLFLHLSSELPDKYLERTYRVRNGSQLASRLFSARDTFNELSRASEGVVRDLINIFTSAYFNASRRGTDKITRVSILEAARQWFEQDKSGYLDDQLQRILQRIVSEVIGTRKARAFMVPRELERHPIVQRLFDARVLHPMQRGYADKDSPGVRYNIYTLDYGTYVDLLGTSNQPNLGFENTDTATSDFVVPFDDKRSIRRIVLKEDILTDA
jgi:hypothetical protein